MSLVEIIPARADNYVYLIACPKTAQAVVVDPVDPKRVLSRVEQRGLDLVAIWNTHHHTDHTGGNLQLLAKRPVAVYGPANSRIPGITNPVGSGDRIVFGSLQFDVIETPGHTLDGISFVGGGDPTRPAERPPLAFTGDALFGGGCGRLFEGDAAMLYNSLNRRLAILDASTQVYFGHEYTAHNLAFARTVEPANARLALRIEKVAAQRARGEPSSPSTWEEELATNPFLRCESTEIQDSLCRRLGTACPGPVEVFGGLRQLRDSW